MLRFVFKVIGLSLLVFSTAHANIVAPDVMIKSVTDEVIAAIRADKDIQSGHKKKLLELIEKKVFPHFNFNRMTQLAMGRNWRAASDEQKKQLVEEFRTLLVRTYTSAFTQYKNEVIDYKPTHIAEADSDALVLSTVKKSSGQAIAVNYNMEKTDQGWKIYNLKIEGVSLVENYRNTFNTEIQKSGIDGLIKVLMDKNKSLAENVK